MNKKTNKVLASAAVMSLVMTSTLTGLAGTAKAASTELGGSNRVDTAVKIADELLKDSEWKNSKTAILAPGNDANLADALAASPLSYSKKAPIYLNTLKDSVNKETMEAFKKNGVETVYIVTGTGIISEKAEKQLADAGIKVTRLSGKNRIATAEAIMKEVGDFSEAIVVGYNGIPDALSISSIAARKGMPIVIANANGSVSTDLKGKKVYALGGETLVNKETEKSLNATRLFGLNRFETNAKIMDAFKDSLKFDKVYLANGADAHMVDALTGSPLAAKTSSPVVLGSDKLQQKQSETLIGKVDEKTEVITLGKSVSDNLIKEVKDIANKEILKVVAVEEVTKEVKVGTTADKLELPTEVKVTLSDKTVEKANVAWDTKDFDGSKAGEVVVKGTLSVPEGKTFIIPENLKEVQAKVVVGQGNLAVETVSAIKATEVTVVLAEKPAAELTADKFVVKANGTDVKVEKLAKVDSDLTGKTYKLTVASLDKTEGKLTVNGTEKAFDFKAPEVKGIEVKDATHIVVNFNEELNEDSIVEGRFNIKKVAETVEAVPAAKVVLNADKKSVTVTLQAALVPADYVLSLGTVAVPGTAATYVQDVAKNGIYAGTEVTFRPTAAQLENKVAPTLAKATYNKGTGILSLTFDKSILDSKLDVTKLSINGVVLTAADTVDTKAADDNYVEIKLGEVSKKAVNALEGDLKLTATKDAYGTADKLTDGETFAIAKEEPAVVKSAAYNQETNILTVTFDQPVAIVEASQADGQTLLSLNVEGGAVQTVQSNNIVGDRTLTQATWKFDLGKGNDVAATVEGLANVATKLKVYGNADIFVNAAKVKNTAAQNDYEKGIAVAYTKDEKKPYITGVEFNNLTNELTLKLSEKATLGAGNFIIDTDEDATLRATIAQNKFAEPGTAKDTFVAALQAGTDDAIITALNNLYASGKDLKLTVAKEVITDTNNLQNDVVDFAHGINVVFHDYVKPLVTNVTTESSTKIKVVFNEKVDKALAETAANYVIKDATGVSLAVTGAQLQADGKTVYLTTATQTSGKPYDVTVSNVKDLQGNIMDTKLEKGLLGSGEVKDAKLGVNALEAKAVQNGKDTLKVTFSQKVDPVMATNLANYAVLAKGTDAKYEDAKAVSLAGATAKIDSADANSVIITLADGVNILNTKEYKIIVSNVKDVYGNELDATKVSTTDVADGDTTLNAPKVTINQLDGKENDTVTLVFDEQLNPETVVKGNFTVDGKAVTGVATSWDAEKKEYTVTLQTGADFTAAKAVTVDDKVVDLAGNKLANGTIAAVNVTLKDSVKPTVSKVEANAVSEAKDTIAVTFDKDVVKASAEVLANYTLTDEAGKVIDLTDATIGYDANVATITLPDGSGTSKNEVNLLNGKNYTVTVANVVDVKGNAMDKVTKTVTWAAGSDATAPTYTVATNAGQSTVKLTFNEKVDLSKVDLSTFTIKYDADKADATNELTKLNPIYVEKAADSKVITITLDGNIPAAAAGKTAIVMAEINEGKEVYDLAGNKAAHDAVNGNDMATAPAVVNVTGITVTGAASATTITTDKGTLQMSAAVTPDTATNKGVTWSVVGTDGNATDLATIDQSGVLTAAKDGSVKVVATAKDGSGVKGEVQITISNQAVADTTAPSYTSATIDGTKKIVTLTFDENVVNNLTDVPTLKAAIQIATDGSTYAALGTNDTVEIKDGKLVITFENALSGATNKIKVAASSLKDAAGNIVTAAVETTAIDAN